MTGAAVLLALAPSVLAVGTATVLNNCGYDVYYAAIDGTYENMSLLPSGGYSASYSEQDVGVSIKLATTDSLTGPITQFEYTWSGDSIFYDVSNINGYPFSSGGLEVVPSMTNDPSNPTCVDINCPAGDSVCTAAYNQPDDTATMVCNQDSNIVLTLCAGGSAKEKRDAAAHAVFHSHQRVHARHYPRK